ncbi:MAG TPA: LLM class flavin-dependent oxidoreductase [Trebonia sp.]|jgi:alkanesulfonate monooxygenase SsuD/methylene tetrahydromethanopterin reductase-like flavin-dependent oxidoreductase (luciferase family)|nr:LLM class flavin-dependent oxidoreductase [Trebonia sp.]
MKFQVLDILPHIENPVSGRLVSPAERFAQALQSARRAEELGFDSVALGERHAGHFLSSGVTVLLGAIAAQTARIRIMTGVTVLSILDPLRVAEDYATVDQLARGRVELVIGKGNELRQLPMFGVEQGQQWDQLAEKYELLRRLWREEKVTWAGQFRLPLTRSPAPPSRTRPPSSRGLLARFSARLPPRVFAHVPPSMRNVYRSGHARVFGKH